MTENFKCKLMSVIWNYLIDWEKTIKLNPKSATKIILKITDMRFLMDLISNSSEIDEVSSFQFWIYQSTINLQEETITIPWESLLVDYFFIQLLERLENVQNYLIKKKLIQEKK